MSDPAPTHATLAGIPCTGDAASVADRVFGQVFRRDFSAPGAALLCLGRSVGSFALRRFMLALKRELDELLRRATGRRLVFLSLARFDQQVTTKYHLDGAPDESFLLLGYEPSAVVSELYVADYTRAAHEMGIDPRAFLTDHNPMFAQNEARLAPYVTKLEGFDPAAANVLLVNNSSLPYRPGGGNLLGVMHKATVLNPSPRHGRVVNSAMLGVAAEGDVEPVSPEAQRTFLETAAVAGRIAGY
jgi:hypothetical protein